MELIYIWFRDAFQFQENLGLQISGKFKIMDSFEKKNNLLSIDIQQNENWDDNFFGGQIVNTTAIIGKNGTGKTTLLDCIVGALSIEKNVAQLPDYVAVFFDKKKNRIFFKHNIYAYSDFDETQWFDFTNRKKIKIDLKLTNNSGIAIEKYSLNKTKIVYYSPLLDLRDFKAQYFDDSIINVSTDFLLVDDSSNNLSGQNQAQIHRHKNVQRQVAFMSMFNNNPQGFRKINLPEKVYINSFNQELNDDIDSNLHHVSKEIRDWFISYRSEGGKLQGKITNEIYRVRDEIHNLQSTQLGFSEKLKQLKLNKLKLRMLRDFVEHFFYALNLNGEMYDFDLQVDVNDLEGTSPWDAFRFFLKKQVWINGDKKLNALNLLKALEEGITVEVADFLEEDKKIVGVNNFLTASNLLKTYLSYLESIPIWSGSNSISDFLQFNWRDLSSGEKAMLDIFSRMYHAKRLSIEKQEKKAKWYYIFFDEGELGFHPEWQRLYLDTLVELLPSIFEGSKIQIFLTSHSPFVVSDLPKSNVIFLDKQDGEPTIVKNDALSSGTNTFAANIHTLLADGFFLEQGLVGAFSQSKIEKALKSMKERRMSEKKEIKQLISLIGEPVIKHKMEQYFYEQYGHTVDEESMDMRIDRLKKELEDLENKKNIQK